MIVGFANGCFDLFHDGHRHFLTEARRQCDYLVVAVNSDRYCREVKGPDRPVHPLELRMLHVRSLAQAAIPFEGRQENLIMEIHPDVVFQGSDHGKSGINHRMGIRRRNWKQLPPEDAIEWIQVITIQRLPGLSTSSELARLAAEGGKG